VAEVGLVLHQQRPVVKEVAERAAEWLGAHGHAVRMPEADADLLGVEGRSDDAFADGLDLVVSLGGDGTMLRSVRLVAPNEVDVLGVNIGHLGYLTEVEPDALESALERYFAGDHSIETRMLLSVAVDAVGDEEAASIAHALNEAVLEKTAAGHTIRLAVAIDGEYFTTYAADALIVATPTGSTAYAFSARGPIVDPEHRAMLLTPVSPHMLFDRTLVLEPETHLQLTVADHRDATLTIDGQHAAVLREGDSITCRASRHAARLVTFGPREFHRILKNKFGLNDR
jgi:NAD+ kinase